ncbi:MAG TPA: endonuclease/exonuclease/phosphatase family protein [Nitriliruptorales bacterium]|nr:endonuclease/exonuclease/phosphatase family protein [Nitriliruptorales bacterium]
MAARSVLETSANGGTTRRRRRGRWVLALAGLYAAAAGGAQIAWWLVGDDWWSQPLNLTTFYWSLPAVPLVVLAGLRRAWRSAALLAVPAGIFLWSYGGLFVGAPPAAHADLRVATYNTYIRAPDVSHVVSLVHRDRPDVLLLQELLPARADQLRARLADQLPHAWFGEPGRVGGVGVLSRSPIVEVRPVESVGGPSRRTAVVVVEVDGRRVQVVAVHLTSPCRTCGSSVVARQTFEAEMRRRETDVVLAALDPDVPAVVGGDLNSTRRSDPYRRLTAAGFRDPQIEAGSGPGFTWPDGSGPFLRIDWVLVRDLVPAGAWVGPPRGSDHRPAVVDLAWHGEAG